MLIITINTIIIVTIIFFNVLASTFEHCTTIHMYGKRKMMTKYLASMTFLNSICFMYFNTANKKKKSLNDVLQFVVAVIASFDAIYTAIFINWPMLNKCHKTWIKLGFFFIFCFSVIRNRLMKQINSKIKNLFELITWKNGHKQKKTKYYRSFHLHKDQWGN